MTARPAAALLALALAASPLAATAAGKGLLHASDPDSIARAMREIGYKAELGVDGAGDPMISSGASGYNFEVYFYDCEDGRNCKSLQFSAGFDVGRKVAADVMNDWNRGKRFGAAFVDDEGSPFLQYDVSTTGGLTEENFADVVDWWDIVLNEFADYIGF